jgi:hypothetical protein
LLFALAVSDVKEIDTEYANYTTFEEKFITGKDFFTDLSSNVLSFAGAANGYIESNSKFSVLQTNLHNFSHGHTNVAFVSPSGNNGTSNTDAQESHLNANSEVAVIGSLSNGKTTKSSQISSVLLLSDNEDSPGGAVNKVATILDNLINKGDTREAAYVKLALSAKIVDKDHPTWIKNGHNVSFSSVYGFGQPNEDAAKAISISGEHKNFTMRKESNNSLPYATKLATETFEVSGSGVKGITFLTFSFDTNHLHNSAMHVRITSPSGTKVDVFLGSATEGHYPGYDYKLYSESRYQFSTRAFLGEEADGKWTVEIGHGGFVPLNHYTNPALTFFGFTEELPKPTQERIGEERTLSEIPAGEDLMCNTEIKGLDETKTYLLWENVDGKYRRRSLPKNSEGKFIVPCLYKNNINLMIVEEGSTTPIKNVTVQNTYDFPKIINMNAYSQVKPSNPNQTFKYVRQDEHLSPLEEHAYATVTIYDQHLRRLRYMGSHEDTGEINIDFKDQEIFKRAILTIEPQQIVDYCDIALLPFRYIEDAATYHFDVFVDEGKCNYKKLGILIELPRRLRPLDHKGQRAFLIGFFVPFTTVFSTIIASAIWYCVVARKAIDEPVGELGASFVP